MALHLARLQHIDIEPGSVGQVTRAMSSGRMVAIDRGPHDVATRLHELDSSLTLHYDPYEDLWVVVQRLHKADGSEQESLVTTAKTCDLRLVARVQEVMAPGYDLSAEIAKSEQAAEKARLAERAEMFGDASEKMSHALRKDLSRHEVPYTVKSRAFFPKER